MESSNILREAFEEISQDTKFIRLATITTFVHSVIFLLYIVYWASTVMSKSQWWDNPFVEFMIELIGLDWWINIWLLLIIWIPLLIWYSVLPPIGEWAMIYYLNNPRKQGTASLGKGLTKFLQMFEFDAAITFFNVVIFLVAISRIYVMDIGWSILVTIAMVIWFIVILFAAFLLPYSRFFITLEERKFFDAMRQSMHMSIQHFSITLKYILVDAILHLRFIFNIIIVFGIPVWLMYLWTRIGIADNGIVKWIFILLVIILFLITAYINGIIEAFFTTYRYKVYKYIKKEEALDEAAIEQWTVGNELATVKEESQQQVPQQVIINQYVVQPGTTPPGPGTQQYNQGQQIIHPTHEQTISGSPPQHIPLPPEAQQYIQTTTPKNPTTPQAKHDNEIDEDESESDYV